MRSKALWLKEGDNNTKFFHQFANHRKVINTIWELKNFEGALLNSQDLLLKGGYDFFKSLYFDPNQSSIEDQMRLLSCFPSVVLDSHKVDLDKLVIL